MHRFRVADDSYQLKDSLNIDSKLDELSKVDESFKLVHNQSRPNSSYSINRQGADNRRCMFEQLQIGKISKDLSDISGNLDQERWDEFGDEQIINQRKTSSFSRNIMNLEVQVPPLKKNMDSVMKQGYTKKMSEDESSFKQIPFSQKFFEQKYGYSSEDHHQEFEKDRSESLQQESSQHAIKNNGINSPSLHQLDTPNVRSAAKSRRQTHIAMKMKGIQSGFNLGKSPALDASSIQSPNNQSRKLTKILQNQIIAQSLPTSANQSHFNYKEVENNQLIGQVEDKTIVQDDETHLEIPKKQHLIILTYMKRFINQMLKRLSYKKFELLSEKHLEMIGDPSFPSQYYRKVISTQGIVDPYQQNLLSRRRAHFNQLIEQKIKRKSNFFSIFSLQFKDNSTLSQLVSRIPIIDPQSLFIIFWESILLLVLLFYLIFTPLKASFQFEFDNDDSLILYAYKIPSFIFTLDIFLGFQTSFYELGRVVSKRKLIAIRYLKKKFFTDFLCTFFMYLNGFIYNSNVLEIIILIFRINQMKQKTQMINEHFRIQNKYPTAYEMFKIAGFILFMSHVWGCLYHSVGKTEDGNVYTDRNGVGPAENKNWIEDQGLEDANWQTKYIFSVYFSIITMVTVGFGDIYPVNIYEKVFVIGMTIISCGVFAYCVNSISSIFSQLSQKHVVFKQKQYDLLNYMNQKNIKMDTQTKIMKYLDYLEEESDQCIAKGEAVLSQFPLELREQVMREYFVKILKDVPILNENFSLAFLNAISLKMKEKRLGPGEKILVKNSNLPILQFITKGSIEYSIEDGEYQRTVCSIQSDKSVIDFRLFITGIKSTVSIQSTTMANVAFISYEEFLEEIKKFHKDYEKFCYLRDQFLNDGRFEKICPSCYHYGHEIYNCPQIHYSVNRSTFSQKVFYSQLQTRQQNPNQRCLDKRVSWRNIYNEAKNDLKYIRWAYIIEQHDLYSQINIDEQMKIIESDKSFFKRCPRIKMDCIKHQKPFQTTKNVLDVIIEEGESAQSLSNSEASDFQTDYSETQYHLKKGFGKQQDEDVMDSLHTEQGGQIQNISIHTDKYNSPDNPQSLSSLVQDMDGNKVVCESPQNNNNNNNNVNGGTARNKSEASIKRSESLNRKQTFTAASQQQNIRSNNRKLTSEMMDLDLNKMRRQSRHMTNRSLAQMMTNGQIINSVEKQSTIQQSFISYQQDKQCSSSSMTNSMPGYQGPMGQLQTQQTRERNQSPNNQQESIRQLEGLVEKFKRQCMKMMTHTLKVDYLSLPSHEKNSREETQSKILTLSRNSKATNRHNTINSVTNTQQLRSNLTLKSLQELPPKKNKNEIKEMQTLHQRNFLRFQTRINPSSHIFGPLQFKFDRMREYQIYYPKGNASNIIKIYKKIQLQKSTFVKQQMYRQRQSGFSDQMLSICQIEKHGPSFQKKIALKMSRMSHMSQVDASKVMTPI